MKWQNQYGDEFNTRDEAYEDAEEMLDLEDILRWIIDNYSASTILGWMGDKALGPTLECINKYFNENYREIEDDDDERAKGYTFCDGADERDVLHYGEYIIDKEYTTWDNHTYRLRAIRYNDKLYWHEMVDGEVVEFRGLR